MISQPPTELFPHRSTMKDFPKASAQVSNDVVCHGIPNKHEILRSGDIINVDVSTIYKGYFSDASRMFMIGEVSPEMRKLVQVTKECMEIGIAAAQPWKQLGDVGAAIQAHAEKNGFSVVRDLCGHGVGMKFHEEPDVEHFGRRSTGMMIVPGMTFYHRTDDQHGNLRSIRRRSRRMDSLHGRRTAFRPMGKHDS